MQYDDRDEVKHEQSLQSVFFREENNRIHLDVSCKEGNVCMKCTAESKDEEQVEQKIVFDMKPKKDAEIFLGEDDRKEANWEDFWQKMIQTVESVLEKWKSEKIKKKLSEKSSDEEDTVCPEKTTEIGNKEEEVSPERTAERGDKEKKPSLQEISEAAAGEQPVSDHPNQEFQDVNNDRNGVPPEEEGKEGPDPSQKKGCGSEPAISKEEEHRLEILKITERAKDSRLYESYDYHISAADPRIDLFSVRKKGSSHVALHKPCQDYCLTAEGFGCTILTDSDGVSSCRESETGARLACEVTVETVLSLAKQDISEKELVKRLNSVRFRNILTAAWANAVMQDLAEKNVPEENRILSLNEYGATLMFAVITENYIVVGNLGDGQILLFHDFDGIKYRVHSPKESSSVRCLVNADCAQEDFQTQVFRRELFQGVLLSSDGIYECLDQGKAFYKYAKEAEARFYSHAVPEPLQPFCYTEKKELMKDLSEFFTMDDCSIVLAVLHQPLSPVVRQIQESLDQNVEASMQLRVADCCAMYTVYQNETFFTLTAVPLSWTEKTAELETAIVEKGFRHWPAGEMCMRLYPQDRRETIESLYSNGRMSLHSDSTEADFDFLLKLCRQWNALAREIAQKGYVFSEAAPFLISFDGTNLYVKPGAIIPAEFGTEFRQMEKLLAGLVGFLVCGTQKYPVFDPGYLSAGMILSRLDHEKKDPLCRLIRVNNELKLKNTGSWNWILQDHSVIHPGESTALSAGAAFRLEDSDAEDEILYELILKEKL